MYISIYPYLYQYEYKYLCAYERDKTPKRAKE